MLSDISVWKEKVKDEGLKAELDAVLGEETELYDRFYKDLQFGTGGLRGKMGVGTACMNTYTVARATEGIALYMRKKNMRKVAISYDSRLRSREFAYLKVTYSALNGTGYRIIPKLLRSLGVGKLDFVTEQSFPDGNFPTCPYPNPEKAETLTLGLRYAKANDSDLLLATDPDADRVGVAVLHDNEYKLLSGNEVGLLLCDYLLGKRKRNNTLPRRPVLIKTIVTSDLAYAVARAYGCEVVEVLTGFKYIGEQVGRLKREGRAADFILGFEEIYGYLGGTEVRDKDAVQASALILEMAAYHKRRGRTLADALQAFYAKYGKLYHALYTYEFAGASGSERRENFMRILRDSRGTALQGIQVESVKDYLTDDTSLPKADVLSFVLADKSKLVVRPSGTEPLIKVYVSGLRENGELKACLDKFFKGEA